MDEPFPDDMMDNIREFFSNHHKDFSDDACPSCVDAVFQNNGFFPLQRKRELARMIDMARDIKPEVVMEIGADKGGGFYHWIACIPTVSRAIACEIRGTPYAEVFEDAFPGVDFLWLPKSSYALATVQEVEDWLDGDKIDILFIDGDKSRFRVDFDAYIGSVRSGGIVFMHDIDHRPMMDVFDSLCKQYRHDTIIDRSEGIEAKQREANGVPCVGQYEWWLRYWNGRSCTVGVLHVP